MRGSILLRHAFQWLRQLPGNGLQYSAGPGENVVVPEPNDAPSLPNPLRVSIGMGHHLEHFELPGGVFKPYAGVSISNPLEVIEQLTYLATAILVFTKTNSGGADHVWFYDVAADGGSLDDKHTPLLAEDKLGPVPASLRHSGESGSKSSSLYHGGGR